jgi:hypothetical protein
VLQRRAFAAAAEIERLGARGVNLTDASHFELSIHAAQQRATPQKATTVNPSFAPKPIAQGNALTVTQVLRTGWGRAMALISLLVTIGGLWALIDSVHTAYTNTLAEVHSYGATTQPFLLPFSVTNKSSCLR